MRKTTLHISLLAFLLLSTTIVFGQSVSKTLVKSFNPTGAQLAQLDLDGPVTMKVWDNKILRVQMAVEITNANEQTLKGLVQVGRYNLRSTVENDQITITAPGLERDVEINGRALDEKISYIVFLPKEMAAEQIGEAITADASDDF